MTESSPSSAMLSQQNRACDACRNHKVRCFPDNSSSKICQRCARTDRKCVYTAPQKRKQRKRTDTRVAELEREVQAMRSLLEGNKDNFTPAGKFQLSSKRSVPIQQIPKASFSSFGMISNDPESAERAKRSNKFPPPESRTLQPSYLPAHSASQSPDVTQRGIISTDLATELFNTYITELVPHYPAVVFPIGVTAAEVRRTKPTLFLAIIAAASGKSDPSLYSTLNSEVVAAYAQQIVVGGQKSVELVQAMIVTSVWYYPPGKFSQLKFYEYIHMAATMALDIGLGTNSKTLRRRRMQPNEETPVSDEGDANDDELEKRRTFLACYLITTGVAMSMRRPPMLRYNSWVGDCLEYLEAAPNAAPSDKLLIGWVKLLIVAEEVASSLSFDDPRNMPSLSESRVQLMLKSFEKKLETWKDGLAADGANDALMLAYHHNNLYLHELAMHEDHPPEDFLPPFTIDHILLPDPERKMTSSYVGAVSVCVSSAHSLIEVLLAMEVEALRALPVFNFARMAYACIVLTKLYVSVQCPTSRIGKVLDRETLRIGIYIPAMIERLSEAVGPMECRSPATFLGLLIRLRVWYENQEMHGEFTEPVKLFGPNQFTPPDSSYSKSPRDAGCTFHTSVSDLAQIHVHQEPAAQLHAKFDKLDPFKDFFGPGQNSRNGLPDTSQNSAIETQTVQDEDYFVFDPSQFNFDMDPYFCPEGMDFSNTELNDWPLNMDFSGYNEGDGRPT